MRPRAILFSTLFAAATFAGAQQISFHIGDPHVSIGVNFPVYPQFVRVPGYPVYYAPQVNTNVFFYDGLYWVYHHDRWYASTWYNGPWGEVMPEAVPVYVLRVPVRYYRAPPTYFRSWAADAPPRWDQHWGASWAQQRVGWDRWDRSSVPAAAPLPVYQRAYTGTRYPQVEQQVVIQSQQYRYQPRETIVRQYYTQRGVRTTTAASNAQQVQTTQSANAAAPGQLKRQQGAQSAKEFAPGQIKKQEGAQSARDYAPGHVKKQQVAQSNPTVVAPPVIEQRAAPATAKNKGKGQRDRDGDGDIDAADRGQGQGHGQGQGQSKGKGKGHGKD